VSLRERGKGTDFFCYAASRQRPAVGDSKEGKMKEVVPYSAKMLPAVGFEPTPRETDLDSVAASTWLTPVRLTCEETIHE
jgi:hypothetical protein